MVTPFCLMHIYAAVKGKRNKLKSCLRLQLLSKCHQRFIKVVNNFCKSKMYLFNYAYFLMLHQATQIKSCRLLFPFRSSMIFMFKQYVISDFDFDFTMNKRENVLCVDNAQMLRRVGTSIISSPNIWADDGSQKIQSSCILFVTYKFIKMRSRLPRSN